LNENEKFAQKFEIRQLDLTIRTNFLQRVVDPNP
jgi:hypothetical protein